MTHQSKIVGGCFFAILMMASTALLADNPDNMIVVDTGYDLCMQQHGGKCAQNKNILIRGSQLLNQQGQFNRDDFQQKVFSAVSDFRQRYNVKADLPSTLLDINNYRIVIVSLLNGYVPTSGGKKKERLELQQEFDLSGVSNNQELPNQHYLYGLSSPFDTVHYAFEWWPVTFLDRGLFDPAYSVSTLNWPDQGSTPEHDYLPKNYLPMNLPFLIENQPYSKGEKEPAQAASLPTLLQTIPQDGHPLLIYYHCVAGNDRTGIVSIAYYMANGGYPFVVKVPTTKMTRSAPMDLTSAQAAAISKNGRPNDRAQQLAKMYSKYR